MPGSLFLGLHDGASEPAFAFKSKIMRARLRYCYEKFRLKRALNPVEGDDQTLLAEHALSKIDKIVRILLKSVSLLAI